MSGTAEKPCGQCGMPRLPHQLARERGEVNHDWREEAPPAVEKLKDKIVREIDETRPQVVITVVPVPDLTLRRFLVEKGVLSEADYSDLKRRDVSPQLPDGLL